MVWPRAVTLLFVVVSGFVALPQGKAGPSQEECQHLYYRVQDTAPNIQPDRRATCPVGDGPRAFLVAEPDASSTGTIEGGVPLQRGYNEVVPFPSQEFSCLPNRKCYFIIQGFGLHAWDAAAILPQGITECPPSTDIFLGNQGGGPETNNDTVVVVQGTRMGKHSSPSFTSFVAFELPDRAEFLVGNSYTVCYSPILASQIPDVNQLDSQHFHYKAGTLHIEEKNFACDFETPAMTDRDIARTAEWNSPEYPFPCHFRRYKPFGYRWLMWQLGVNSTETPGTGPSGDATPGLEGQGRYAYIDSPGFSPGMAASLVSPPILLPPGLYCASFSYEMYGIDVSSLRVYLTEMGLSQLPRSGYTGGGADAHRLPISTEGVHATPFGSWGTPRWVAVGNKGAQWHRGGFEFNAAIYKPYILVFEALAGRSEAGDVAIDDLEVRPGACPVEVRSHTPRTFGTRESERQSMICGEVRLVPGTHAADKSWYVEGAISCAGRGYALDDLESAAWLPCCVPNFGTYKLILEDGSGDGWTGSQLEFRFFDRVLTFGRDGAFRHSGYSAAYKLTIGTLEIERAIRLSATSLAADVRVARSRSYVWCGVVQAGRDGQPLGVNLTPELLKTYGARSTASTVRDNEVIRIEIPKALLPNTEYDMYCYSEVVGEGAVAGASVDREILATRLRVSTDVRPPKVMISALQTVFNAINVTVTVDESATVWCLADPLESEQGVSSQSDSGSGTEKAPVLPLFSPGGALAGVLEAAAAQASPSPSSYLESPAHRHDSERLAQYFRNVGVSLSLEVEVHGSSSTGSSSSSSITNDVKVTGSLLIPDLVADTRYAVLCYAEDQALPVPNALSAQAVHDNARITLTESKVPHVRIARRQTLLRGFLLTIESDAPGTVWCAAATRGYGVPTVQQVIQSGVSGTVQHPARSLTLEIRGLEPDTPYRIYCAAAKKGYAVGREIPEGDSSVSTQAEMEAGVLAAVSYGRYCEAESEPKTMTEETDMSPFHPITTEEQLRIRDYILTRPELALQGVYRVTLLPNKTEIYNYFDGLGPKPLRYARVRAGRCVGNVGYYEQLRVGPLNAAASGEYGARPPMKYERLQPPVETDCGGYNPQGVFGRRRLLNDNDSDAVTAEHQKVIDFLESSFGYVLSLDRQGCSLEEEEENGIDPTSATTNTTVPSHPHMRHRCFEIGPIILEETCPEGEGAPAVSDGVPSSVPCSPSERNGRVWMGLKTPLGQQVPLYFIYALPSNSKPGSSSTETVQAWAKRIVEGKELPEDFHLFWQVSALWYEGRIFASSEELLTAVAKREIRRYTPETFQKRQETKPPSKPSDATHTDRQRRQLDPVPMPFPGAAGTAGPNPSRLTRRGDLEYRAVPEHVESQGKRFTVEASTDMEVFTIKYAGWSMTFTTDRDTGLRVWNLRFLNQRVAFEMGLMEALAHYTVSERNFFFLDSWYGGLGSAARKVHKGIECPKTGLTLFWDESLCVFEQDMARPVRAHWKAGELRDGSPHVALVLRQMITVSNYDYVTDYRFHLTGMFDASVSFTGELYAGIEVPWYSARQGDYGAQVTGAMRFGALHAHLVGWKIDFDIGEGDSWKRNSVLLTEVIRDPNRPGANKLKRALAETEKQAAYFRNDSRAMVYEVVNEQKKMFGNMGGWRVMAYAGLNPLNHDYELYAGPASWAKYRVLSTVHKYGELDITLPRDNKFPHRPAVTLDRYAADDEPIRNVDVVSWISDGIFHVPVAEDMPLTIPIGNLLGWLVKPSNLFPEDPTMDLNNAMGGGLEDPGTCAVVRLAIGEVEPSLDNTWRRLDV